MGTRSYIVDSSVSGEGCTHLTEQLTDLVILKSLKDENEGNYL